MAERYSRQQNTRRQGHNRSGMRRLFTLNIGTIIFSILLIYIIISAVLYISATHVKSYQVTAGPLAKNQTYTGIALYDEQVVTAGTSGYVSFYAEENRKVKSGGVLYGISSSKEKAALSEPDSDTLSRISEKMEEFSLNYSASDFGDLYSLRYGIEAELLEPSLGNAASSGALTSGNVTVNTSPASGIVCYETDGFENAVLDDLTAESFDKKAYRQVSTRTDGQLQVGDTICKIIQSEKWSLAIPLSARQIVKLQDISNVKVRFLKDGNTQNASLTIVRLSDDSYAGELHFSNGLIRYIDSRFVSVELVTNTETGLKIPVSSMVTKTFYTIPDAYAQAGGSSSEVGFEKQTVSSDGSVSKQYVSVTIFAHENGKYYVDTGEFNAGDIIYKEGSTTDRYIIGETDDLDGVYSMNKGYAVFRRIVIIDSNEDYCLVQKGTDYGIAQYDNIVLDASSVKESQITA